MLHFYKPTPAFCDFVKSVSLGDWMLVFNAFLLYRGFWHDAIIGEKNHLSYSPKDHGEFTGPSGPLLQYHPPKEIKVLCWVVVVSNMSCFHPELWGNDPNWRSHIFEMGGLKPPTSLANNPWIKPYFLRGVALWGFRKHDTCRTAQQMWPDITKLPYFKQGNSGGKHIINQLARTTSGIQVVHPRNLTARPWKMMVGRRVSFWDCLFFEAMLNFRGVYTANFVIIYITYYPLREPETTIEGRPFPMSPGLNWLVTSQFQPMGETAPLKKSSGMNMS